MATAVGGKPDTAVRGGVESAANKQDRIRALAGSDSGGAASTDLQAVSDVLVAVQQDAFRYSVALACAKLSHLAYAGKQEIAAEVGGPGVDIDFFEGDGDIFGFVVAWPEHIAVAFRGTASFVNWRVNFRILPYEIPEYNGYVSVHGGFHAAYAGVRDRLTAILDKRMSEKRRKIYLTGHSLGGALATIACAYFSNRKANDMSQYVSACYTFGAPRVGNQELDVYVRAPLYRITRGTDLVPALPPHVYLPGFGRFFQSGDTRYFRSNPRHILARRRPPSWLWNGIRGIWSVPRAFWHGSLALVSDHDMGGYVERIRAAKNELDRVRDAAADRASAA
jgi:hypothetical protein